MRYHRSAAWLAVLCSIVLVAGAAALVSTPAEARAVLNWGHIWKTQLQPRADQRYYTKQQATKLFAPKPKVIRGTYDVVGVATAPGQEIGTSISYGVTISAPPAVHYIAFGDLLPSGCAGSPDVPDAHPGNLCIFESDNQNASSRRVFDAQNTSGESATFGANIAIDATGAGQVRVYGTWALRPLALSARSAARQ